MAIKIIKRGGKGEPEPAPVKEGGLAPQEPAPERREPTDAERLAHWKNEHPPIGAKARPCPYCKHDYIKPCDEKRHVACQNWLFLQGKTKAII